MLRKKISFCISLILVFAFFSFYVPVNADSSNVINSLSASQLNQFIYATNELIKETEATGSSVTEILRKQISYYENLIQSSKLLESQIVSAKELIACLQKLIVEYEISSSELTKEGFEIASLNNASSNAEFNSNSLPIIVPLNPGYNACVVAVAACIAYFTSSGYVLSAELLTHARANTSLNSYYYPIHASIVKQSPVFTQLRNGTLNSGSSIFPNSGTTAQKDLYYAIHKFSWARMWGTIHIYDTYDFKLDLDYNNLFVDIGVNVTVLAQGYQIITPFKMEIAEY